MKMHDLIIIGGGASGMACAITAAKRGKDVLILEKNPALGKKIYATGNGRCNITNSSCENAATVQAFFHSLGVEIIESDEGRMYPGSFQAGDVVFMLERGIAGLGVKCERAIAVDWIEKTKDGYRVSGAGKEFDGKKVVIACGGKAAPKFGTTGDGYALAQSLGHSVVKPIPVLTAIECNGDFSLVRGVRAGANCTLILDGKSVFSEKGEVQFTEYGLSGICIFNMSRHLLLSEDTSFSDYEIHLDFTDGKDIKSELKERLNIKGMRIKDILRSLVPEGLGADILEKSFGQIDLKRPASEITNEMLDGIEKNMKDWTVQVKGAKGWQMAQCTKGGITYDEVDAPTMESLKSPGLYFAGEVLDYDGPCGGFNLQHAWETGIKAGNNV